MASSFLCLTLLFITFYPADGFEMSCNTWCVFNSTDMNDIEYIRSYYYNKLEFARFTSRLGRHIGFTEYGIKTAKFWNSGPVLGRQIAAKETFCQPRIRVWYKNILSKSVEPYVTLSSTTPPGGRHPAMLVCSVYDFYPKNIKVSWLRDGQEVTSDVTYTDELADGGWYYQIHSHLEYTPRSGEKISCKVEHASLKKPLIKDWDPAMPESERNKIAIGASGLILGLVLSLAGFIYYRRKAHGHILVPSR